MMTQPPAKKNFKEEYNDLNDSRKAILRTEFLTEHGYSSFDTFYKKMNDESPFRPNEKNWLANRLGKPVEDLFPTK